MHVELVRLGAVPVHLSRPGRTGREEAERQRDGARLRAGHRADEPHGTAAPGQDDEGADLAEEEPGLVPARRHVGQQVKPGGAVIGGRAVGDAGEGAEEDHIHRQGLAARRLHHRQRVARDETVGGDVAKTAGRVVHRPEQQPRVRQRDVMPRRHPRGPFVVLGAHHAFLRDQVRIGPLQPHRDGSRRAGPPSADGRRPSTARGGRTPS